MWRSFRSENGWSESGQRTALLSSTTEMLPSKGKNRPELSLQSLQVMLIIYQRRDIEIAAILAKLDPPPHERHPNHPSVQKICARQPLDWGGRFRIPLQWTARHRLALVITIEDQRVQRVTRSISANSDLVRLLVRSSTVNFSMVVIFTFSHFLTTSSFFLLLSSSIFFYLLSLWHSHISSTCIRRLTHSRLAVSLNSSTP